MRASPHLQPCFFIFFRTVALTWFSRKNIKKLLYISQHRLLVCTNQATPPGLPRLYRTPGGRDVCGYPGMTFWEMSRGRLQNSPLAATSRYFGSFLAFPASAARGAFSSWPESHRVSALIETSRSSAPCSPQATAPGFV